MNSCTYRLRPSAPQYQNLVNRIVKMVGLDYSIDVFASDTDNACATLFKRNSDDSGKPIIAYNPLFIESIKRSSPWAVYAVFAHEVAHHYNKDLYGDYVAGLFGIPIDKKSHRQELNADRFAGWVLRYEGASLSNAMEMYQVIPFEKSYTHPSMELRMQAMKAGWIEANNKLIARQQLGNVKRNQANDVGNALLGIAALALIAGGINALSKR